MLCNPLRGLLGEYGLTIPQGIASLRRTLAEHLSDPAHGVPELVGQMAWRQYERLLQLDEEIAWYQTQIKEQVKQDSTLTRLTLLSGYGPLIASAFKSWVGDRHQQTR